MTQPEVQREAARNALLRRADWRFLLPNPTPRRSVCFANGLLRESVAAISERVSEPSPTPSADCDLAVAVNPDSDTLRAAWAALCEGGACYTEWHTPLLGGASSVRRRLTAAGFTDAVCYWAWPAPQKHAPQIWLPLEATNVLHYFSASHLPTRSRATQLLRTLYHLMWQTGLHTNFLLPICAVARKPSRLLAASHGGGLMPSALLDAICADASARDASARLNSLSYLLLTPGHRSENKVIGLIFAEGQVLPRMIVKLPRTPEAAQSLRNEVTALRKLHALRLGGMPGVPHLLFYNEHGQCVMVGQTALAGQPIHVYVRRETFRPLALKVTNWLADLAINTAPQPRAVWWSRLAAPLLRDFEQNYGGVVEPAWIHAQRTLLDSLEHLPLVCEHRDFQLDNVYLSPDGEVQVLDWEAAELQGLPALDLIFFLAYLVFSLEHTLESSQALTETCKAYRRAVLDTTTFTGSVVAECLVHYAQRVGLDPAALRPLRVLAWLIPMRWQYLDHQSDAGGTPSPETLRQSLFINLWKEELSAALTAVHQ